MSLHNKQTVSAYNQTAGLYIASDAMRSREGFYNGWIDDAFRNVPQDAKILEIGSAQGRDAMYLQSKGYMVQVSDASEGFLDHLKSQGFVPLKLDIIAQAPEGMWDVVFASAVFLHFTPDDFQQALHHIHGALDTGAIVVFNVIQGEGELTKNERLGSPRYFKYYNQDEIRGMLFEAGFKITDMRSTEFGNKTWLYVTAKKEELAL